MTLRLKRSLDEMRPVLMDAGVSGPDPVYVVYRDLENGWVNQTEITAGRYGIEYPKTFGHIHLDGKDETYFLYQGTGLIVMQNANEFLIARLSAGQKYTIPHSYAHCWINIGNETLITWDDHEQPQSDYELIKNHHGFAYYFVEENGELEIVSNPHYSFHPPVRWLN